MNLSREKLIIIQFPNRFLADFEDSVPMFYSLHLRLPQESKKDFNQRRVEVKLDSTSNFCLKKNNKFRCKTENPILKLHIFERF